MVLLELCLDDGVLGLVDLVGDEVVEGAVDDDEGGVGDGVCAKVYLAAEVEQVVEVDEEAGDGEDAGGRGCT